MKKYLKRGNTWEPYLVITDDGEEMDCTGYVVKLWVKEKLCSSAPEILELNIVWIDQPIGTGFFEIVHEDSINLLGRYWYEIILYEELSLDVVATLVQNKLIVRESLKINL